MNQKVQILYFLCLSFALPLFGTSDSLVLKLQKEVKLLEAKKDYTAANEVLDSLSNYFLKKKELSLFIGSQLNINDNLQKTKQYKAAIPLLNKTLSQIKSSNTANLDSMIALTHHEQGINFFHIDDYLEAIPHFKKALQLRANFLPKEHVDFIKGKQNIGNAYYETWDYDQAIAFYQKALSTNLARPEVINSRLARTYQMLGKAHFKKGDLELGEEYLVTALGLFEEIYQATPWRLAGIYIDFSVFFENQQQAQQVVKYAKKALETYQALDEKYDNDWWGMANAYNNLGIGYELQDSLSKALNAYQQSIFINNKFGEKRQIYNARTFNNISYVYRKQKDDTSALVYIDRAITINQQAEQFSILARNYNGKADILVTQGQYEAALALQQKALQYAIYPFDETDIYKNPNLQNAIITDKLNVLEYLASKANTLALLAEQANPQKNYEAAIQTYHTLVELTDIIRYDFQADASKSFLSGQVKIWLEQAIETAWKLAEHSGDKQWLVQAFDFAERSKAAVLLEAVQRQQAKLELRNDHPLLQKEQKLLRQIAQQEQIIFTQQRDSSATALSDLRASLLLQRQALQAVRDSLEIQNIYHQSYRNTFSSLADIQASFLKNGETTLMQFFVGERNIYRFVMEQNSIDLTKIPLDFALHQAITQLRNGIYQAYLSKQNLSDQDRIQLHQQYARQAWQLYQHLFYKNDAPIVLQEKIIVIPDGILAYIPFDALLQKEVVGNFADFSTYDFLARHYQISYAYSAALLTYAYRTFKSAEKTGLLAFVPNYTLANTNNKTADRQGFAPLKYSQQEAENILKLIPNSKMISNASTQDFHDVAADYAMLHFSAHAMVNPENPDYSFIAFSQHQAETNEEELLFINDIYASTLFADMVVLSACETGLGKIEKGEGVMSLARAFTYAGAKSIITSLWRVNDHKTTQLMTRFYEHLQDGESKDAALYLAKRAFIEKGIDIHPYFWAGFVPIGNMSPIRGGWSWWWIGLGLGVLGIGGLIIFRGRDVKI